MNWINGMLKKVFFTKEVVTYANETLACPQAEEPLKEKQEPVDMRQPPGETAGRHALQRRSRSATDHCRLPLESQNAIFFSGLNK